ncbi:MAG: phosphate ABC transporter permease subunit PstC [Candidatus Kapabacteria bacterium]|jgi:phosphate transport system permease protein|nr:phosphate ABC transporter permease subunit PstC [Candidatus Kapabacteria bacterium]
MEESPTTPQNHAFLRTKNNLGERLIERSITIIGSFAVVLIFLILLFVLREALPLLTGAFSQHTSPAELVTEATQADTVLKPEIYNPDIILSEEQAPEEFQPEVYNLDVVVPATLTGNSKGTTNNEKSEEITLANILGTVWQPVSTVPKFGIMPLVIGTAKTTFVAIFIGAPLGILAALYAVFFAPVRLREFIKPMVEILAGFPSVVIGFFCLLYVGSALQTLFGFDFRLNAFVGGIGLSIAVIPIVFTITEDALSAVPKSLLEGSLAMGATQWESAYKVMLPAAFPGVFAAVLLGIGRAFGETMIALMASGNAAMVSASIGDPVRTFSATIGAEMGEVIWGSAHYSILFFLGVLLFIVSFTLNAITELFVKERLAKKLQGG